MRVTAGAHFMQPGGQHGGCDEAGALHTKTRLIGCRINEPFKHDPRRWLTRGRDVVADGKWFDAIHD